MLNYPPPSDHHVVHGRFAVALLVMLRAAVTACCGLSICAIATGVSLAVAESGDRPNVVLIIADDLGKNDVGVEGADLHETPNIDALAASGVRFTNAYSPSCVCSPTRASLLTGKSPARLHITIWAEGSRNASKDRRLLQAPSLHDLPRSELTLARYLQASGYLTASVGKWHLGEASYFAEAHGFDIGIAGNHWGAPATFFFPYRGSGRFGPELRYVPDLEFGRAGEYLTDRLTDKALEVIDHSVAEKKPFFLYLPHYAPHTPIEAKPDDVAHFTGLVRPELNHQNPVYAAMVRSLDDSVGRVMKAIRERGLEDNTIVIFTSDNGGFIGMDRSRNIPVTSNYPLRSGKGSLYEGGIRVPLYIRWPGVTSPGGISNKRVVLTDLFPTLMNATGEQIPENVPLDGIDLKGVLRDAESPAGNRDLYFHYPHYYHAPQTTPCSAVISDNRKLIEYFEDGRTELYDLTNDPAEAVDLSSVQPELAEQLRTRLQTWRRSVGAALPAVNRKSKVSQSSGVTSGSQRNTGAVQFRRRNDRLEVSVLNRPVASWVFSDPAITRPYFAHIHAGSASVAANPQISRNHPPASTDAQDHPTMHPGIWTAFGDLSGADSWRLKTRVESEIIEEPVTTAEEGRFRVRNRYRSKDDSATICEESCLYRFVPRSWGTLMIQDSTLLSRTNELTFSDQMEEMGLGVRVAMPIAVKTGSGGRILDSEGRINEAGVRERLSDWCDYSGPLGDKHAGMMLMGSPQNPRRIWWHARDYGFVTANPFHAHPDRTDNQPLKLNEGQSVRFVFGIALHCTPDVSGFVPETAWQDFLKLTSPSPETK